MNRRQGGAEKREAGTRYVKGSTGKGEEEVKGRGAIQTSISYGGTAPMRGYMENPVREMRRNPREQEGGSGIGEGR